MVGQPEQRNAGHSAHGRRNFTQRLFQQRSDSHGRAQQREHPKQNDILRHEKHRHRRDQCPGPKDQCTALVRVMSHGQAETGQQDEHPADTLLPQMAGHPGIPWQLHPKKEDHIPQAVVAHHADEVEASQLIQQGVTVCRYF